MNAQRNYQRELEELISRLDMQNPPRLLLHGCCAPCSSYVLEYLSRYFRITLYFYNPNICTEEEYLKRADEVRRLLSLLPQAHPVTFVCDEWDHAAFEEISRGLEGAPEGGERCRRCYELRLRRAAEVAAAGGYDFFTTTLSISPYKRADWINEIGEAVGTRYGVRHLPSDFKKKGGYARSVELSGEYGLYRQDYCGCRFSLEERRRKEREKET